MLRNRIHALLDWQRELELPQWQRYFWSARPWFFCVAWKPESDATLLREQLALHDLIAQQMKAQEKRIAAEFGNEAIHQHLLSVPGSARLWPR